MNEKELRELDTWIAKNVMGWNFITSGAFPDNDVAGVPPTSSGLHHPVPRYSTDAAMQVLEKCAEQCDGAIEIFNSNTIDNGPWCVTHMDGAMNEVAGYAETLPLAICLFARKLFSK